MKRQFRNVKKYIFHEIIPTGIEKGKSFKRQSKGQISREARRYRQNTRTGIVYLL